MHPLRGHDSFIFILSVDGEKISTHSVNLMTQGAIIKENFNTETIKQLIRFPLFISKAFDKLEQSRCTINRAAILNFPRGLTENMETWKIAL